MQEIAVVAAAPRDKPPSKTNRRRLIGMVKGKNSSSSFCRCILYNSSSLSVTIPAAFQQIVTGVEKSVATKNKTVVS